MTRLSLTTRPRVPMLVRATFGALVLAPVACGDDGNTGSSNADDIHPTAGPCAHGLMDPSCESTGVMSGSGTMGTAGTDMTIDSGADVHPTAGPCAHDPQAPECATTTDGSSDSGTGTDGSTGTGTDGSTGTGTDTGTSSG